MSQSFNQPISQTFVPSIYRGASPVIIASDDVLDGRDTSGRSASPVRAAPEDLSRLVSLSDDTPGMHF